MIFGSVCSGIEAASVAWHPLGWKAAWLAEIEPFPSAVLAHHYPDTPNLGDMTKISAKVLTGDVVAPDVLVGGTPCQAFSLAGLREGLNDGRGQLTIKYMELANAIDFIRQRRGEDPAIIVWENVPGVLSDKTNAFGCFLAGLAGESVELKPAGGKWSNAGCVFGPQRTVAWRVLDAQYFGVAQRRRRVFVVASARKGFDPAAVLFEFDGARRDSAPSREAGEGFAATLDARTKGGGFPGTDGACGGHIQPVASTGSISHCLNAGGMGRLDYETETMIVHGTQDPCVDKHLAFAMGRNSGQENVIALPFDTTQISSPLNFSNPKYGDPCHPLAGGAHIPSVAYSTKLHNTTSNQAGCIGLSGEMNANSEIIGALDAGSKSGGGQPSMVMPSVSMQVRRLTPVECERLQGFPDNYTRIPNWNGWRKMDSSETPEQCIAEGLEVKLNKKTGKWRVKDVDGPRYKALGNSMAVPCMFFIGSRINAAVNTSKAAKKVCA